MPNVARHILWSVMILWLALVTVIGWRMSQHFIANELDSLASSAEYENLTTARIVDRLFTEMTSVANMAARLSSVIELASRYRVDTRARRYIDARSACPQCRQSNGQTCHRPPLCTNLLKQFVSRYNYCQ